MCQAEDCALVCHHKDKDRKSHILLSQNSGKNKQPIPTNDYGTSLCMTCASKHWCAIHTGMSTKASDAKKSYFSDDSYRN